jgi:hypothetical protein
MNSTTLRRPQAVDHHETYRSASSFRTVEQFDDQQQTTPRRTSGEALDRSNDMYLIIEDLARDRIAQIRRDAEQARQVRARRKQRRPRSQ